MKFDWYQASVPNVRPEVVMEALAASDYYGDWEQVRPGKGYDQAAEFIVGDQVLCRVNFGGQNAQYGANVIGSGSNAPKVASVLREHFPDHRVSRVDACEDYHHDGAYDYLRKNALKVAKEQKVQCREIIKPVEGSNDGRTLYLGSVTSSVQSRIYEKGLQLGLNENWVRAELQVRPQKLMKEAAAKLTPDQLWGIAKWSLHLAQIMGKKQLNRVDVPIYQPSDHDRAYHFMLKQYRRVLEQMLATHGSPETVGAQIFHDLAELSLQAEKTSPKPVKSI